MANNKQQANIGAWDAMMAKVAGQPEIERLRAEVDRLRAREQALEAADEDADGTLVQAVQEMKRLKDENTRLRAAIDAMRPIVEALATSRSVFAELDVWVLLLENSTVSYLQELVTQARAFVAAHPATDTDTTTGEE